MPPAVPAPVSMAMTVPPIIKEMTEKIFPPGPSMTYRQVRQKKAKIHSQHKPGCHRHTISQCSHHKTAPFVLYSIKTIITSISYDMRRPPSKMRESFQRKQVYTKRMGMENPITPQSVIRLPLSLNRTCSSYHKKTGPFTEADSLHVLQLSEKTSRILRFYHTLERKHIRGKTISDFIFFLSVPVHLHSPGAF